MRTVSKNTDIMWVIKQIQAISNNGDDDGANLGQAANC